VCVNFEPNLLIKKAKNLSFRAVYVGETVYWRDCVLERLYIGETVYWRDCILERLYIGETVKYYRRDWRDWRDWRDCILERLERL